MKKFYAIAIAGLISFSAFAQSPLSYGIKAGVNLPQIQNRILPSGADKMTHTSDMATNFYFGGYASIPAATNFAVEPGLFLQGKGGKIKSSNPLNPTGESISTNLFALEIPVNAVYYIPTADVGSIFLGAGPYVGFNLFGNEKSGNLSQDINFGNEEDEVKRFDFGVNFQVGYKLTNGLLINAGYGLGLADLDNIDEDATGGMGDMKTYNRVLSFGVGFQF